MVFAGLMSGGIIRAARRPPGWQAPGPVPPGARGRAELAPGPEEDLCFLSGDWRLFQKQRGHRWSLDDLVTAHLATELPEGLPPRRALDLGCGLGSVLLMMAWKVPGLDVTGVEAQAERAALARRSIAYNGVEDRCRVLDGDLRTVGGVGPFELITGTPPYFPRGTGSEADALHVTACRFEYRGGVEAYLAAAARWLTNEGRFVMCAASLEDQRVRDAQTSLHVTHHRQIVPRAGKAPLISVWQFARTPAPVRADVLTVRDESGQWTEAFRAVRQAMGMPSAARR